MTTDFRASQIQTNKIIASGSTGTSTNALLLIYPISKQSGSNQGFINTGSFGLSGIGTDVFMFVSGAIGSRGTAASNATTVFGGDVHISGVLTFASATAQPQYWTSTVANTAFTTGSVQITGSVLLGTGSHAQGQYLTIKTVANGLTMNSEYNNWLHIAAGSVNASGSGGRLILSGGNGGYTSLDDGQTPGGNIELYGGNGGDSVGGGSGPLSAGGGITLQGGAGIPSPSSSLRDAGIGGTIYVTAGSGGSSSLEPAFGTNVGGYGGSLAFTAGDGGLANIEGSWATGGNGGEVNFFGGFGGASKHGAAGSGGAIGFTAGQGGGKGTGSGSVGGNGGSITFAAGTPGYSGSSAHGTAGNVVFTGGTVADTHYLLSASTLQFGGESFGGYTNFFRRVFFNKPTDQSAAGFPGRDIFFYVSGTVNGAFGNVSSLIAVLPDTYVSGTLRAAGGLSGSLQKLNDGRDYLIAGATGITVNTNSLGQIEVSGNNIITVVSKSGNFTLAITDQFVHIFTTASHVTMSLPSSPGARQFMITKISGANSIVISGSSYTVNGASGDYIMPGSTTDPTAQIPQAWMLYSDSVNWFVR